MAKAPDSSIFDRLKWHHYLELIAPVYFLVIIILSANTEGGLMGQPVANWRRHFINTGLISVVLFTVLIRRVGTHDFRFKILFHMALALITAMTYGILQPGLGINDTDVPDSSTLINFILILAPSIAVYVGAYFSIYALINPFTEEIRHVSTRLEQGDLSVQISNPEVLADGAFGPASKLLNLSFERSKNVLQNISQTSVILQSSAEELQSGTEEINASAEEVASTSQAMSHGATTQTELINDVSEEIKSTTKLVDEIIASIRNNTNQVSQIALQTNILALNAGIEASRAGDYGRGFAVVAENIRKLSDQSKGASESISEVADEIAARLEEAFNKISSTMLNVVSVSEETAASAEEVAAAAEEMTATIEEIASTSKELATHATRSLADVSKFQL